jgi:hypothetical protein
MPPPADTHRAAAADVAGNSGAFSLRRMIREFVPEPNAI